MQIIFCLTHSQHFGKENADAHLKESDFSLEQVFRSIPWTAPNCLEPATNSLPSGSGYIRENLKTRFQTSSFFSKWLHGI